MKNIAAPQETGLVLGIETATARGGVALVSRGGEVVGETTLLNRESHAERLLPALEQLLALVGSARKELIAVAVSTGPGSFTGLRTGLATAKGLAFSLGVPLYGVPTTVALAANAAPGPDPVCAVLNARRGEVFRARFRVGPSGPERLEADAAIPVGDLAGELEAGTLIIGELPPSVVAEAQGGGRRLRFAPAHLNHPRAAVVALCGLRALLAGEPSALRTLLPAYVRAPDAAVHAPSR